MQLIRDILVFVLVFGGHVVGLLKVSRKTVHLLLSPFELVLHPVQITLSPTKVQKMYLVCLQFVGIVNLPYLVWYSFSSRLKDKFEFV